MSLEFNKVAGAVLGSLVFAMGVGFVADLIYDVEAPETPGFEVAVADAEAPADEGPAEGGVEPIAVRLASADPARGEGLAKACASCHDLSSANTNKAGPGLWNIVNRQPGTHEGFNYSAPMVEFGQANVWDYDHLDAFISAPKEVVPGTKMAYAGMKKPEDRAALVAYLRTLSDSPAPLPAAEAAAEAPAAEAAPAEAAPAEAAPAEAAPAEAAPAEAAPAEAAPVDPTAPAPAEQVAPAEAAPAQ